MDGQGLYGKYIVRKADSGEEIMDCFVLRPWKDPAAMAALREYARVTENKALADDILQWVDRPRFTQEEVERAQAIKLLFPDANEIYRAHRFTRVMRNDADIQIIKADLFPSCYEGQTVKISEIIKEEAGKD